MVVAKSEATNVSSQGLDLLIRKRLLWVELCPPLKKDMLEAPEPMNVFFLGGGWNKVFAVVIRLRQGH